MRQVSHWIDGKPWSGRAARTGDVFDPATGQVQARVDLADASVVAEAVTAARAGYEEWRSVSLSRRTQVLFRFRELLAARRDELAAIITSEHGKVLADAAGEVQRGLEVVEFACGIPSAARGSFSPSVSTGIDAFSLRQPIGVAAIISPFNFPAMVPMWFFPVAIACGNAVVLKPSEKDPTAANWLAALWDEAGLPTGVFNVVHGDRETVEALLAADGVDAVSFVGSTPVARHIYQTTTAHGKRVQALGGAKNHMVVLPDADVDAAADAAVSAGFGSAGERCMAISVVVAVDPVGDALIDAIRERIATLRVGDGRRGCDMGPLVTREHRDGVAGYPGGAAAEGADVVVDGRDVAADGDAGGFWLGPSLVDRVRPGMRVYDDEIFGPVLSVCRCPSYDAALSMVNANPYGNGVAVFTADGGAARHFVHEVEVGMVGVNVPIPVPMAWFSFGGWGQSLFGDSHAHGEHGVHFYTRTKAVTQRWIGRRSSDPADGAGVDLGFPTQH